MILGGVFLCATGGEALYADMGHIGAGPIRLAWYALVLPSLILSYAGQTGRLLEGGAPGGENPFFLLAPAWSVIPLVVLATVATIIASQAIITGAFSMTRQAMQLGWMPAFDIRQTSDKIYGQIYVPTVNVLMGAATLAITLAFRTSDHLAGAYGTAVSTTMVLTSLLLLRAMRTTWRWSLALTALLGALFLCVDLSFFVANLAKIMDGGWVPLSLGGAIFFLMITWRTGVQRVRTRLASTAVPTAAFFEAVRGRNVARVPGALIYLTRSDVSVPEFVVDYVRNVGALPQTVIALHIVFEERPRVAEEERGSVAHPDDEMWRVTFHYGFVEDPHPLEDLAHVKGLPPALDLDGAVFIASRDTIDVAKTDPLTRWRRELFAFLFRNGARITDRFNLPHDRTLEIARHVKI
jgi:KUP system potassium uptake protein